MESKAKKLEIAVVIGGLAVLALIWAWNGYEDTWLYVTAGIIVIPASWFFFGKRK